MRRIFNNINRNNNVFNNYFSDMRNNIPIYNAVHPDFFGNQQWIQGEERNGVKIIELNSSESSRESSIKNGDCNEKYLNQEVLEEIGDNNYKINEEARQRRRFKSEQNWRPSNASYFEENKPFFSTFHDEVPLHHQRNCFTIINNQQYSDTSSADDYDTIEIIELDNNVDENNYWDHVYNDEVVPFDTNTQPEKPTVWIYSYKNKSMLAENDFELVNNPSRDTYSSTSTSHSMSDKEDSTANRLGSPIPTYIPRLDLSLVQTLSTVTELSERNKSDRTSQEKIHIQQKNNWLTERHTKIKKENDILSWMALSPRERRRRSTNLTEVASIKSPDVDVTCPEGENKKVCDVSERSNKTSKSIQVEVDVHEEPIATIDVETSRKDKVIPHKPIEIYFDEEEKEYALKKINEESNELDLSRIPDIKIKSQKDKTDITEPLEKLDCNNWIKGEEKKDERINYNEDIPSNIRDSAPIDVDEHYIISSKREEVSHKLWKKHLQLMKPPQWIEYLPITCGPPSIDLSLSLPSVNSKKSWFKRLVRCIKCCK